MRGSSAIDAVNTLAASNPNFPWKRLRHRGPGRPRRRRQLLRARRRDRPPGARARGRGQVRRRRRAGHRTRSGRTRRPIAGGHTIPGTEGLKVSNYIVQPEDSGVGVFAHEYGHDLGLPDLYDTSGAGDSDVDFWDLMSSGSHSGPIFQAIPTHMGLWDKWVLGWADPVMVNPGDRAHGRPARTDLHTRRRAPATASRSTCRTRPSRWPHRTAEPTCGTPAPTRTGPTSSSPDPSPSRAAADAKFWMWNNYIIEEDWDFGFVEVSTDGGATWTEQKVFDETGAVVITPRRLRRPERPAWSTSAARSTA